MAADKKGSRKAKGGKRGIRGKLPVKRSINLILIDENRISPIKATLGVIVVLALAMVFAKYMVLDRINEVSAAQAKADRLRNQLDEALATVEGSDDIEEKYAHYSMAGMTQAELGLVDRTEILALVEEILPVDNIMVSVRKFNNRFSVLYNDIVTPKPEAEPMDADALRSRVMELFKAILPVDGTTRNWSVSGNVATLNVEGSSLERLNQLAREIEQNPIVNSCSITTATKNRLDRNKTNNANSAVQARFIVYLQQPAEGGSET